MATVTSSLSSTLKSTVKPRCKWPALKVGDCVDIVAPASATAPEVVDQACDFLRRSGFVPRRPEDLLRSSYFHANTDERRLQHLQQALLAKDSQAVWCLRGGYGSNRLLPGLSQIRRPSHCKLFIGISDVTSLHLFLLQKWRWNTLHATLLDRPAKGRLPEPQLQETLALLQGQLREIVMPGLQPMNSAAKKTTKPLWAPLVGGNLMTLQSAIGTPWALNTRGALLFLEEIDERGYRLDRMFQHLLQSGSLRGCRGIVFGPFLEGEEADGSSRVGMALQRFAEDCKDLPMWSGVESGHGERLRPLPLGPRARLVVSENSSQHFALHVPAGWL